MGFRSFDFGGDGFDDGVVYCIVGIFFYFEVYYFSGGYDGRKCYDGYGCDVEEDVWGYVIVVGVDWDCVCIWGNVEISGFEVSVVCFSGWFFFCFW